MSNINAVLKDAHSFFFYRDDTYFAVCFRSLHSLLDYEGDDIDEVFCLSFVMSREVFGSVQTDELKPGGANIPVTQKNK